MIPCLFASDLHGHLDRYHKLLAAVRSERPAAVFLGGDLLPHGLSAQGGPSGEPEPLLRGFLARELAALREELGPAYPRWLVIFGNDDPRSEEPALQTLEGAGLLEPVSERWVTLGPHPVLGYPFVPPTPFALKDWERYDVSRFVDPGGVSPEEGARTVPVPPDEARYRTIAEDLERLTAQRDLSEAILLCHSPPYQGALDRAALDGQMVDHAPLDVHVGSIALQRFIAARQPRLTLHGHVHESARLTGAWREQRGRTLCLSAAHDGPELALVRFDADHPADATRALL